VPATFLPRWLAPSEVGLGQHPRVWVLDWRAWELGARVWDLDWIWGLGKSQHAQVFLREAR
jgi:hypothetical protein